MIQVLYNELKKIYENLQTLRNKTLQKLKFINIGHVYEAIKSGVITFLLPFFPDLLKNTLTI